MTYTNLSAVVLAAVVLGLSINRPAAAQAIRTPRVMREGQIDTGSVDSIVAAIVKPGMTDKEKAFAVYDFLRHHIYHWAAAREGAQPSHFEYGVVYDTVKLINVYGYGYCFQNRSALEGLWQAVGLDARSVGIGGHSIAEVFYDGQFHFLDADQHGYCLLPDGKTVASVAQIVEDPIGLILKQPNPSTPFFPATQDPKVPYESKVLTASYFHSTSDNYYAHDKMVHGHAMNLTLLPGMRFTRRFTGDGRWNLKNDALGMEYKVGYVDPNVGPRAFVADAAYGNGDLLYQPDLTTRSDEYRAGVWAGENIEITRAGLRPAAEGKPAWCVFRMRLPYVIAGWPTSYEGAANPVGAAVISATFHRGAPGIAQGMSVSTDDGQTWQTVWTNSATGVQKAVVDISRHVVPKYEYLVRFDLGSGRPADSQLETVAINTGFQLAPNVLPAVEEGKNPMVFSLGTEAEVTELVPNLSSSDKFVNQVHSFKGIWLEDGAIKSKRALPGEVVFKLEPPRPGTVHGFSVNAGCRREPFGITPKDDIKIYYAEDEPKDWKLVYDDDVPEYMEHWSYRANAGATCTPGTKCVYVKFAITTVNSACMQYLHLWTRWKPEGSGGVPERGIRVQHGWTEGGKQKIHEELCLTAPRKYTIVAGSDVANTHITMEPVRAVGLAWRENDPPVKRPPPPEQKVLNDAMRDEMRTLLREIDADPAAGLPKAAKSEIGWLSGGAKQAQNMLRGKKL